MNSKPGLCAGLFSCAGYARETIALWQRKLSCAGLTRASIALQKCFCEEGWIAGSSPAMT
jgi:hypothetical protein